MRSNQFFVYMFHFVLSRFDEQLQRLLVKDSETLQDTLSLPLYLPESLVSMPQIIQPFIRIPKSRSPEVTYKLKYNGGVLQYWTLYSLPLTLPIFENWCKSVAGRSQKH